jgi:hypothetical protein
MGRGKETEDERREQERRIRNMSTPRTLGADMEEELVLVVQTMTNNL